MKMPIVILAGGASRRMGRDKAFVEYDGVPMIERTLAVASRLSERIVIISNKPDSFKKFGEPVYPDTIPGMGPLSGLYTGFKVTDAKELLLVACDMPLVSEEVMAFILLCADRPGDAVIPFVEGREQGLFGIYRRSAVEKFRARIEKAEIQFNEFRMGLDKSYITEKELKNVEPELGSFMNVNRPEDLA